MKNIIGRCLMQVSDGVIIAIAPLVFFIVVIVLLRQQIKKARKISISVKGLLIEGPGQDFANLYEKMYTKLLKEDHIKFYRTLLDFGRPPTVKEIIPDFNRESSDWRESARGREVIGMLRALRGLGFIEPKEGGEWKSDTHVMITEFGKEMHNYIKR
jgi:hypothetical protein